MVTERATRAPYSFRMMARISSPTSLACSADTQTKIDQQVVELVKREHDKAVDILTANREKLDRLAAFLYEKETITGEEFMHILGE